MKKIIALLFAVLLLAGSFACSKEKSANSAQPDTPINNTENKTSDEEENQISVKMLDMPQIQTRPESPVGEVTMPSYEVEALLEVAEAYLTRMYATQYEDPKMTSAGEYWFLRNKESAGDTTTYSPEAATSQNTYYTSCSPFIKDVFWQAWNVDITDPSAWTAAQIAKATKYSLWNYKPTKTETLEEKNKIKEEFLSILQPGDIISLCHSGASGHILLYVGNGWAIHSNYYTSKDGGNYDQKGNAPKVEIEGSVEYRDINTFFKVGNYYYFWEKEIWSILRPSDYLKDIKLTEQTKLRMENLQDIYAEKISSHPVGKTAVIGEEITYGIFLRNYRSEQATVEIKDVVPENTTYVGGAEKIDGKNLSWSVTLEPGEEKLICYTVKVDENEALYQNGIIVSNQATAGGVILPCNDIHIMKRLSDAEMQKLEEVCKKLWNSEVDGIELAEEIFKKAGIIIDLPTASEISANLFKLDGKNFSLNTKNQCYAYVVPHLYGGYKTKGEDTLKGVRNKFIDYSLITGDIIICRESTSVKAFMCVGEGKIISLMGDSEVYTGDEYNEIIYSVFGNDAYAVLRLSIV